MIGDSDGGITVDAAIAWIMTAYGLSEDAAIPHLARAWKSGNIRALTTRGWDYVDYSEDGVFGGPCGEPVKLAPFRCEKTGRLVDSLRLRAEALQWQIEQQLGRPTRRITSGSGPVHKGGAPPIVAKSVKEWFDELPDQAKSLGGQKLAGIYKNDPNNQGSPDHVRKLIAEFQKAYRQKAAG